jgi:HSP20 family protein
MANSNLTQPGARLETKAAPARPVFVPATDIWDSDGRLILVAEIPGVDADGIDIKVERAVLTVTARNRMTTPDGYSLIHAEYRDGDYERAFTLPAEIDVEHIEATVKDGLLTLVLPKITPAPARRITVKTAGATA